MSHFKLWLSLVCLVSFLSIHAQASTSKNLEFSGLLSEEELAEDFPKDLGDHIKEVFMKGSSDGESVFTVVGLDSGVKLSKKIMKKMVRLEDWVDLKDRFKNEGHENDFKDEWDRGAEDSRKSAPEILKAPWRSVKKVAYSHRVTVQQARDAYESSGTVLGGVVKYTGLFTWALIKDSYYLVIETPWNFIRHAAITVGAVPFRLTLHMAEIGLRFSWNSAKATAAALASGFVMGYSVVSSIVGAVVTLIIDGPRYIWRPLQMSEDLKVKPEYLENLSLLLEQVLAVNVEKEKVVTVEAHHKDKMEKFKVYVGEKKEKKLAYVAKLMIKNESIYLDLEMARGYFSDLKQELKEVGVERSDRKNHIKTDMGEIARLFKAKIPANFAKLPDLESGGAGRPLQIEEDLNIAADRIKDVGVALEQSFKTVFGDGTVIIESKKTDKRERYSIHLIQDEKSVYSYDVTISTHDKLVHLDLEMVARHYRRLSQKFKDQGVIPEGINEYVSLELRNIVTTLKGKLAI